MINDRSEIKMYFWRVFITLHILFNAYFLSILCDAAEIFTNFSILSLQQNAEPRIELPKTFNAALQQNILNQQPQRQENFEKQISPENLKELHERIRNIKKDDIDLWNSLRDELEKLTRMEKFEPTNNEYRKDVLVWTYQTISTLVEVYNGFTEKTPKNLNPLLSVILNFPKTFLDRIEDHEKRPPTGYDIAFGDSIVEFLLLFNQRGDRGFYDGTKGFKKVELKFKIPHDCYLFVVCLNKLEEVFPNIPADKPMIFIHNACITKLNRERTSLKFRFYNALPNSKIAEYFPQSGEFHPFSKSSYKTVDKFLDFEFNSEDPNFDNHILTVVEDNVTTVGLLDVQQNSTDFISEGKNINETEKYLQSIYQNLTSLSASLTETDFEFLLDKTNDLLESIVAHPEKIQKIKPEVAVRNSDVSFSIMDRLISASTVWRGYNHTSETQSADKLFNIMSLVAEIMNVKIDKKFIYESRKKNLYSRTQRFEYAVNSSLIFKLSDHSLPVELVVPFSSLNLTDKPEVTVLVDVSGTLSAILKNPVEGFLDVSNEIVNSPIFSLVLERKSFLVDEFYFRIHHKDRLQFGDESVCSFWNKSSLTWMSTGCRLDEDQSSRTVSVCYCSHTTNFAAIMDVSNREINETSKLVLTSICSTLTIIAAGLAMYLPYRYPRRRQNEQDIRGDERKRFLIIQNLCGTVIVSHLFIMFGMGRTESPGVCVLSAILLFFFLLATFVFMFLMLSFLFVVGSDYTFRLVALQSKHFLYAGYSLPGAIVVFSVGVIFATQSQNLSEDLCGEYFCWIASKKRPNNLWFFVVPVVMITVINCVLTGLLFQRWWEMKQVEKEKVVLRRMMITFTLFTLTYGLPWLLFVFYINRKLRSFAYVFIVINGCHGIMLLYHQAETYWNELKIDYNELKKKLRKEDSNNISSPETDSKSNRSSVEDSRDTADRKSKIKLEQSKELEQVGELMKADLNIAPWP